MSLTKTHTTPITSSKNWRAKGFTLITSLLALALMAAAGAEFFHAWILRDAADGPHLWHISELVGLAILLAGTLLALLRRPEKKPLLAQFLVLSMVILAVDVMFFEIKAAALFIVMGLFVATYPVTRALLSISPREGRVSKVVLVLSLLTGVFLAPVAIKEINWQIIGMTENDIHALDFHWIGSALLMVLLVLAGVLSSTKRPGWMELGIITGVTYSFLGVIAMILQDGYAGSWSGGGGLFAIVVGVWYILFTILEAQKMKAAKGGASVTAPHVRHIFLQGSEGETIERNTQQLVKV